MEINNSSLFKYTLMKQNEAAKTVDLANMNFVSAQDKTLLYSDIVLENEINVASIGSTITDEALENIYAKAQVPTVRASAQNINFSTVYKDFQPEEITKIKQLIYNIHNEETTPDIPNYEDKSFISEFYDAETLFEYMNIVNPEITKETGVTRKQLVEFTQDDDWEDTHYDFFGSLNRIFVKLDTEDGTEGVLSFDEIQAFIDEELGKDFKAYSYKVNEYTNEIQKEYEELSSQDKLEFAIERTREYLEASGLDFQLEALNRLMGQTDLHNTIHVGNIAIANLNVGNTSGSITLGSYNYWSFSFQENHYGVTEDVVIYAGDSDSADSDLGITLDISLLEGKWYELVNTLVHELTHATAYRYYEDFRNVKTGDGGIAVYDDGTPIYYPNKNNKSMVDDLYKIGALTEIEKDYFYTHWESMSKDTRTDEETEMFNILLYRASCAWGEYSAYQADADYNDSIGQDIYYQAGDNITTAVDGDKEKDKITDHIESAYNHYTDDDGVEHNESTPDYKWWTYV